MKKTGALLFILFSFINCQAIFVEDISNTSVTVFAPTQNAKVTSGVISFNWDSVEEATLYQLQVASPNFTNAAQLVLDTTITKTAFSKDLAKGNYQWRVKAINSGYQTSYTTISFEVQ
ncbi:MAG: hypothetical protein HWD85_00055 [Flavobacteriaceae bacterium]|nr:hypothetical protein [Flavobacteriaceae bacterium]